MENLIVKFPSELFSSRFRERRVNGLSTRNHSSSSANIRTQISASAPRLNKTAPTELHVSCQRHCVYRRDWPCDKDKIALQKVNEKLFIELCIEQHAFYFNSIILSLLFLWHLLSFIIYLKN